MGKKNRLIDTVLRLRHIDILEIDGDIHTLRELPFRRLFNGRFYGLQNSGPFYHMVPP